mgnify:CR=1 FL=1
MDNQQQSDKIFVNGMRIERKFFNNGGSIDKVGINVNDFIQFLQQHVGQTGWVNFDIKTSQNTGQPYAELNQWQPQQQAQPQGQNMSPQPQQQYQQPQQQHQQPQQAPQQYQQQPPSPIDNAGYNQQ